jgi:cellulose biosynthesis protein BcsQ
MIPAGFRLFTWLDAEEVIAQAPTPTWLVGASAYWNELCVKVTVGNIERARKWVREVFEPRIGSAHADDLQLVLESLNGDVRTLPVIFEEVDPPRNLPPLPPTFARPSSIESARDHAHPSRTLGAPPIAAFHSFKGGVGRTTHAISLAVTAAQRHRVLLIDADVEAPGISWLTRKKLPDPPIAFADLIALAHGDPSPECGQTVKLVADRLRNAFLDHASPLSGGCYVLPAFRDLHRLPFLEIRPEHLIKGQNDPFILTSLISAVARALDVHLVIVDLRAGYSELAAGLLLDPRVYRVFVTTLSGQALEGTLELLNVVGERSPSKESYEPYPAIVVSQIPESLRREAWQSDYARLLNSRARFLPPDANPTEDPLILESGFDQSLQTMAADWEHATRAIASSAALRHTADALLEWLPIRRTASDGPTPQDTAGKRFDSIARRREHLKKAAQDRIFAERLVSPDFLDTAPLRALAGDNISQLPIAVIVGAKGAGKTFTFLQQARIGTWKRFVEAAAKRTAKVDAPMIPVLFSSFLSDDALRLVSEAERTANQTLGVPGAPVSASDIRDVIQGYIRSANLNEAMWREVWLDCIAWASGFQPHIAGAGRQFAEWLDRGGHRLIALFDGLEDLFQEISSNPQQQLALRVLLQDVPLWLGQRPTRSLAVLVYIRRDLVSLAIRQNDAQFLDRYEPYRLHWDRVEALRLAAWIRTLAFESPGERTDGDEDELKERLVPLWGRKLGSDDSREARSADWVLNALSDYNGQIQARDLLRFIAVAAGKSIPDGKWEDRDLTPQSIRDALPECSREKIAEIKKENDALRKVFEKMEKVPQSERLLPFESSFAGLDKEDLRILQENGAIMDDGGEYSLPEIYLHGLGFSYTKPGRRRVLSNRRK